MSLNATTFLDFEEIIEWLKIDERIVGLSGDTKASLILQDLTYISILNGTFGNAITIEYKTGGTAGSETVVVSGNAIEVTIQSGVTTATQLKAAIDLSAAAIVLVSVSISGIAGNFQTAPIATTNLTNGVFDSRYKQRLVNTIERLMNSACTTVERKMRSPLLIKEFEEDYDGTNSNVIVPNQWPVKEITELKIDFNRAFDATSIYKLIIIF